MINSIKEKILFNSTTLECINYALVRANKISSRAGIAWVLQDENKKVLHSDATIAGINSDNLAATVKYFGKQLDQLIITIEPVPYLFNIESLVEALASSNCKSLIVCYTIPDRVANHTWDNWLDKWDGEIVRLPLSLMGANLSAGPRKILSGARPWVTTISGADMYNSNKNINDFSEEFGVTAYIKELANQSRAILYSPDQKAVLNGMDEGNFMDEAHEYFEVNSATSCEAIFRHCIIEKRCSVVILANMELLFHLMQNNLTDEIVHHLAVTLMHKGTPIECNNANNAISLDAITTNETAETILYPLNTQSSRIELPLSEWTLQSSTAVGKCSRLHLKSNKELNIENDLRQRLN